MSALSRIEASPALCHRALARPDWWRCRLRTPVGDALGTVTGLIMLGTVITSYEVRLDDGDTLHAWPAAVLPATSGPAADAPAHRRFAVIEGGRKTSAGRGAHP